MRILVVDDEPRIANAIRRMLVRAHYSVDLAYDSELGLELAMIHEYDLIILDRQMLKLDGLDLCRQLRHNDIATPIVVLSDLGSPADIIRCLNEGADDYLTKPFDFGILMARIQALIRRSNDQKRSDIRIGDLVIQISTRSVYRNGQPIEMTAKEFALLEYFVMNRGKVLTREQISEHVWDINFDPKSNVIESLVRLVRQKIDRNHDTPLIKTVRGVGYRLSEV